MSSEDEMKKWHIDRIQTVVESTIQNLEAERTEIRSQADLVENTVTTLRNPILTAVSFAAPIILSLIPVGLPIDLMLKFLIANIVVGLIAFIVFTVIRGRIHSLTLSMDASFLSAIRKLNYFRRYFNTEIYHLQILKEERIVSFFNYANFASMAVQVDLIESFENMSKSRFFKGMRNDLQVRLKLIKDTMRYGLTYYEENISS